MKDIFTDIINKFFGLLGFLTVLWRLFWEIVFPPHDFKNVDGQVCVLITFSHINFYISDSSNCWCESIESESRKAFS
jgi:hypothetical protein